MSGELHGISLAIGSLQGQVAAAANQRTEMLDELRGINEKLETLPMLAADIAEIKPKVEQLERERQRRLGIVAGVSLGAGGFGAGIIEFLRHLLTGK